MISKINFLVFPNFLKQNQADIEHKFVMSFFPQLEHGNPREKMQILYRSEYLNPNNKHLLIQSNISPEIENIKNKKLAEIIQLQTKDETQIYDSLLDEQKISYKIRINPVITLNKKRIPIKGKENILEWWKDKADTIGLGIIENKTNLNVETTRKFKNVSLSSADLSGVAFVKDKILLKENILKGVGREKSYGYGLLLLGKA